MDTKALVSAPGRRRSRRHSPEFKAQVIAACLQPGVSIAAVAQANGLNANFLRTWVKAYRDGQRTGLTAKRADESPLSAAATLVPVTVQTTCDTQIEIRRQSSASRSSKPFSHFPLRAMTRP